MYLSPVLIKDFDSTLNLLAASYGENIFIVNICGSLLKIYSFSGRFPRDTTYVTFLQLGHGIFIMSYPLFSLSSPRHV